MRRNRNRARRLSSLVHSTLKATSSELNSRCNNVSFNFLGITTTVIMYTDPSPLYSTITSRGAAQEVMLLVAAV
jgi:hypothetical protein